VKQKIFDLRDQGLSVKRIAAQLSCAKSTVSYHLQKRAGGRLIHNDPIIIKVIQLYSTGISANKVSKELHLPYSSVKRWVKLRIEDIQYNSKSVVDWRREKKKQLVEYKGGKCEICGYNKCIAALEFHHVDKLKKDFTISSNSQSFEKLKKEVDKYLLVCSNCHKEIHYNECLNS
jgi:predicted transcriptional regulator